MILISTLIQAYKSTLKFINTSKWFYLRIAQNKIFVCQNDRSYISESNVIQQHSSEFQASWQIVRCFNKEAVIW